MKLYVSIRLWLIGLSAVLALSSRAAVLEVTPSSASVCSGDAAEFTATLSDAPPGPISYMWSGPNGFFSTAQTITVTNLGRYSAQAVDANGQQFGPACVTLNIKRRPTVTASGGTLTCAASQIGLFAWSSASNAVFSWTGPGIVSGGDTERPIVNAPGTYVVTVTSLNGCTGSTNVVVNQDLSVPTLTVQAPDVLTCLKTQVVLSASSGTTNVAFHWTGPGIVQGTNSASCIVDKPGIYTVTATTRYYSFGIVGTGSITVTNGQIPIDSFGSNDYLGFYTNIYLPPGTNLFGPIDPNIILPGFDSCDSAPQAVTIDQNGVTNYPGGIIFNGSFTFHYDEALSHSYTGNGCSTTAVVIVEQQIAPPALTDANDLNQEFITMGQGFWSSKNGKLNGIRSADLVKLLLINPTNQTAAPIVIGKPGRSLTIPLNATDWLEKRLPAVGAPNALPPFGDQVLNASTGQTSPSLPLNRQGRFENTLLGETIALSLNLRLDPNISPFELSLRFCSQKGLAGTDGLLGTDDDLLDIDNEKESFNINPAIFDALCDAHIPHTVAGLLELANRALAGQPLTTDLREISGAIETVNRAFEEARFCVECP